MTPVCCRASSLHIDNVHISRPKIRIPCGTSSCGMPKLPTPLSELASGQGGTGWVRSQILSGQTSCLACDAGQPHETSLSAKGLIWFSPHAHSFTTYDGTRTSFNSTPSAAVSAKPPHVNAPQIQAERRAECDTFSFIRFWWTLKLCED